MHKFVHSYHLIRDSKADLVEAMDRIRNEYVVCVQQW